mgnify:FL=1
MAQLAVEESVQATLDSERGRWVLRADHSGARSEYALVAVDAEGRPARRVIDRTFVDRDSGVRWLVDYKNSRPGEGESLADFCTREAEYYHEQLESYACALRQLGGQEVRSALFFTALGHLHELTGEH